MMPGTGSWVLNGVGVTRTFEFVVAHMRQLLPTLVMPINATCAVAPFSMKSLGPPLLLPVPLRFLSSKSLRISAIFLFISPRSFMVPLCCGTYFRNSCIFSIFSLGLRAASTSSHLSIASGGKLVGIQTSKYHTQKQV